MRRLCFPPRLTRCPNLPPHPTAPAAIQGPATSSPELSSPLGELHWKASSFLQLSRREHEGEDIPHDTHTFGHGGPRMSYPTLRQPPRQLPLRWVRSQHLVESLCASASHMGKGQSAPHSTPKESRAPGRVRQDRSAGLAAQPEIPHCPTASIPLPLRPLGDNCRYSWLQAEAAACEPHGRKG